MDAPEGAWQKRWSIGEVSRSVNRTEAGVQGGPQAKENSTVGSRRSILTLREVFSRVQHLLRRNGVTGGRAVWNRPLDSVSESRFNYRCSPDRR